MCVVLLENLAGKQPTAGLLHIVTIWQAVVKDDNISEVIKKLIYLFSSA